MFWTNKGGIELRKKHLFIALFVGTNQRAIPVNAPVSERWTGVTSLEGSLRYLVKKIDAPSMNIGFERGLANNYVHYFQQGEINWEPINVTFVDATSNEGEKIANWKTIFTDFLKAAPAEENNRTGILDLPIFCTEIKIESLQDLADLNSTDLSFTSKEFFIIKNPRITKISFGSFDYSSDEANEITVTFVPEWCDFQANVIEQQKKTSKADDAAASAIREADEAISLTRRQ
jgi:hypothetical protein